MLYLIGLGNSEGDLSLNAHNALLKCKKILIKSNLVAPYSYFAKNNLEVENLDRFFTNSKNFENCYKKIVDYVKSCHKSCGDVAYCVEGSGIEDKTFAMLSACVKDVKIFASVAKAFSNNLPTNNFLSYCATDFLGLDYFEAPSCMVVITDIDSKMVASELKIRLSAIFGDNYEVIFSNQKIQLYELDMQSHYDYSSTLTIDKLPLEKKNRFSFSDLVHIVKILRGENGCPWDREQTFQTLRKNMLEESYEVVEAIDQNDMFKLQEELGDLLLQPVFIGNIASEQNEFDYYDIFTGICKKLIFRHSHIFGGDKALTKEQALETWEKNKIIEKSQHTLFDELDNIPKTLPSLAYAKKVISKIQKHNKNIIKSNLKLWDEALTQQDYFDILLYLIDKANKENIDLEILLNQRIKEKIKEIEFKR